MTGTKRIENQIARAAGMPKPSPQISELQKSADAIARSIAAELPKHAPIARRELLVQVHRWVGERVAAFDAAARAQTGAVVVPTAEETQVATGAFGKGCRTSDLIA